MWFSFDGFDFQTHTSEAKAKAAADDAMSSWRDDAGDGWDELATQVCYGKVTHAVRVEREEITDENRHTVPYGSECIEFHHLEPINATCDGCMLINPGACPREADQPTQNCILGT